MIKLVVTGSHPTPAEAVIEQLPDNVRVYRWGDLAGPKLARYDWRSLVKLPRLIGLTRLFKQRLKQLRPNLVLSFGGYPAVPVCWAAKLAGVPVIIHEQTFGAGLASRLTAPLAQKIAVSWDVSLNYFSSGKTILTGNPVRRAILSVRRRPENVIYITGGSQGAQIINQTLKPILPVLTEKFVVYHQFGRQPRPPARKNYLARRYFTVRELTEIYSRARLVVGRSGINTVTELGYLQLPAVLIPLPFTQKNEQLVNARYLADLGLARLLTQAKLTPENLLAAIQQAIARLPLPGKTTFPRERVRKAAAVIGRLCSNYW
jgi:UDP-N-acetylglucosamine--N-acetylmuramyl-(pentapeptide) pyrophosphoryl-undecaprenol N-acetylglucosamine transferase